MKIINCIDPSRIAAEWKEIIQCPKCLSTYEIELSDIWFKSKRHEDVDNRTVTCPCCQSVNEYFFNDIVSRDAEKAAKAIRARYTWNKLYKHRINYQK